MAIAPESCRFVDELCRHLESQVTKHRKYAQLREVLAAYKTYLKSVASARGEGCFLHSDITMLTYFLALSVLVAATKKTRLLQPLLSAVERLAYAGAFSADALASTPMSIADFSTATARGSALSPSNPTPPSDIESLAFGLVRAVSAARHVDDAATQKLSVAALLALASSPSTGLHGRPFISAFCTLYNARLFGNAAVQPAAAVAVNVLLRLAVQRHTSIPRSPQVTSPVTDSALSPHPNRPAEGEGGAASRASPHSAASPAVPRSSVSTSTAPPNCLPAGSAALKLNAVAAAAAAAASVSSGPSHGSEKVSKAGSVDGHISQASAASFSHTAPLPSLLAKATAAFRDASDGRSDSRWSGGFPGGGVAVPSQSRAGGGAGGGEGAAFSSLYGGSASFSTTNTAATPSSSGQRGSFMGREYDGGGGGIGSLTPALIGGVPYETAVIVWGLVGRAISVPDAAGALAPPPPGSSSSRGGAGSGGGGASAAPLSAVPMSWWLRDDGLALRQRVAALQTLRACVLECVGEVTGGVGGGEEEDSDAECSGETSDEGNDSHDSSAGTRPHRRSRMSRSRRRARNVCRALFSTHILHVAARNLSLAHVPLLYDHAVGLFAVVATQLCSALPYEAAFVAAEVFPRLLSRPFVPLTYRSAAIEAAAAVAADGQAVMDLYLNGDARVDSPAALCGFVRGLASAACEQALPGEDSRLARHDAIAAIVTLLRSVLLWRRRFAGESQASLRDLPTDSFEDVMARRRRAARHAHAVRVFNEVGWKAGLRLVGAYGLVPHVTSSSRSVNAPPIPSTNTPPPSQRVPAPPGTSHDTTDWTSLCPASVVAWALGTRTLSKTELGQLFGCPDPAAAAILRAFTETLQLEGAAVDVGLREFLSHFFMSGEGQVVDRVLQVFANRWDACNPRSFPGGADDVHTLAFAILLLHTSFHNPSVEHAQRLTLKQFEKSVRDCGVEVDAMAIASMYERVRTQQFSLKASSADVAPPVAPSRGVYGPLSSLPDAADCWGVNLPPDTFAVPCSRAAFEAAKLPLPAPVCASSRPPLPGPLHVDAATTQRHAASVFHIACTTTASLVDSFTNTVEKFDSGAFDSAFHPQLAAAVAALIWPYVVAVETVTAAVESSSFVREMSEEAVSLCSEIVASCGWAVASSATAEGIAAGQAVVASYLTSTSASPAPPPITTSTGVPLVGGTALTAPGGSLSALLSTGGVPAVSLPLSSSSSAAQIITYSDTATMLLCG